jgi:hypothetical protein
VTAADFGPHLTYSIIGIIFFMSKSLANFKFKLKYKIQHAALEWQHAISGGKRGARHPSLHLHFS